MPKSPESVVLGEVDLPSGILLILDPGLGRYWRHDGEPCSPRAAAPQQFDLQIVGPDAVAAGRAYDRQFDPRYLFDVEDVDACRNHFADFAKRNKMQACAEVLPSRVSHVERARLAVEIGAGAGVVHYNGLWSVAVGNLPKNRSLPIQATPMPAGEFAGRWRSIDLMIDPKAAVKQSLTTQGVMVDHGQLLCSDLEAFGEFRMWESQDGLADFVFWGKDAEEIAQQVQAPRIDDRSFGWTNVRDEEIGRFAQPVQDLIGKGPLKAGVDYRPHCNLENLNKQIRDSELEVGQLVLHGARVCGFSNRWGDGLFEVIRDLDARGRIVRVRLDVGNDTRQTLARRVLLRWKGAIVTRKILDEGEPIRFAERLEPDRPEDSGWAFSSGMESQRYMDNAKNLAVVQLGALVDKEPALAEILDAAVGSVFRREGDRFVEDKE
jgi:hypothetical protein